MYLNRDNLIALLVMCLLGACTQSEKLQGLKEAAIPGPPNAVNVNFCTDVPAQQKFAHKMVIILDHSGSNKSNFLLDANGAILLSGNPPVPTFSTALGTDPKGTLRYGNITTKGTLLHYLKNTAPNDPSDPSKFFALVNFNNAAYSFPANSSGFTSDVDAFYKFVQQDAGAAGGSPNDAGATNYLSALDSTYAIINTDITNAEQCAKLAVGSVSPGAWCPKPGVKVTSSYTIVFMSDGAPIISTTGVGLDASGKIVVTGPITVTRQTDNEILAKVSAIVELSSHTAVVAGVNLFTVYYYLPTNVDPAAQRILANMAKAGNGVGYNALSGSTIDYTRFTPAAKKFRYSLSNVFITNASVSWWNDGSLLLDTDNDGLPDDIEDAWGSDALSKDSGGRGVTDLVAYQVAKADSCCSTSSNCSCSMPAPSNYAAGACSTVTNSVVAGRVVFKESDPNGLNDCEKILLGNTGGVGNPDSNGDQIPDFLQFKNGVSFQLGTTPSQNDPLLEGLSIAERIQQSLPVSMSTKQLGGIRPANYDITLTSQSNEIDCYRYTVTNLPQISDSDTVRVDVIMKTNNVLQESYLYRKGEKKFHSGSGSLDFYDWNNADEMAAKTWRKWP